ncbi:hypothetical protein A0H81_13720 [Grifola frondosa]|uniref:Uncharacterized protein n=1 Tax=Grifola frondosa TaxID=5627 RepID=A0A1C7LN99_GRIFR|nr:hypothetical protein A0H81_13720 [Grifola frondosa]
MANLIRSAKSGNDWTKNELRAYNINVVEQSLPEFFGLNELPPVPPAVRHFCEITDRALAPDDDTYKLLHHLDLAQNPKAGQEAAIDTFTARLLETLGYARGHRIILTHQALPLIICGTQCSARTDVCICDKDNYLLLVQRDTDTPLEDPQDPEPQLIADAVAAYQRNNFVRDRVLHIPTLDEITFPGITLVDTYPTFYKIKVTAELSDAVVGGVFPANPVVVYRHSARLPHRYSEGMTPVENRTTILQYYQAFKAFV